MEKLIVACVQPRMRVFNTIEEYIDDIRRFMNVATHQDADLIVFPELLGAMIIPALMENSYSRRGRQNGQSQRGSGSLFQRANLSFLPTFGTNLREDISAFIKSNAVYINQIYADVFGSFAREYNVTIVGPSGYLADPLNGIVRHMAGVFSAHGDQLGYQSKMKLSAFDNGMANAGKKWNVIPTSVGNLGIVLGDDILYPDVCQILASQGAEILIAMAACEQQGAANRIRMNAIARAEETQLFTVVSYVVGDNAIAKKQIGAFTGNSAILAPKELTVSKDNLFIEIVENSSEGVITAELDFGALQQLHKISNRPTISPLSSEDTKQLLLSIEEQMMQPLPPNFDVIAEPTEPEPSPESEVEPHQEATEMFTLDDLPIVASISARWPLMPLIELIEPVIFEEYSGTTDTVAVPQRRAQTLDDSDDETEEMDVLFPETPVDSD